MRWLEATNLTPAREVAVRTEDPPRWTDSTSLPLLCYSEGQLTAGAWCCRLLDVIEARHCQVSIYMSNYIHELSMDNVYETGWKLISAAKFLAHHGPWVMWRVLRREIDHAFCANLSFLLDGAQDHCAILE